MVRKRRAERISIPAMNASERSALLGKGLVPSEWITSRMLSEMWGVNMNSVNSAKGRGKLPEALLIGSTYFYPRLEAIKSWTPRTVADKAVFEFARELQRLERGEPSRLKSGTKSFEAFRATGDAQPKTSGEVLIDLNKVKESSASEGKGNGKSSIDSEAIAVEITEFKSSGVLKSRKLLRANYLNVMADTVTEEDWAFITKVAVGDAKKGDYKARQWLTNYLIGTPIQRIDLDAKVTEERFSDDQRRDMLEQLLVGELFGVGKGTGQVIDADDSDETEAA